MRATLKSCLELDVFNKAIILAGKNFLSNEISGISVLETANIDVENYSVQQGEIIISSLFADATDEEKINIIKKLGKLNVAALLVMSSDKNFCIPKEMMEKAENEELPIIFLLKKKDLKYGEIIKDVMEKILFVDNFGNRLISNTIFHLLNFEKYGTFESAVKEAAISNNFQLIILSEDFNPILTVETRHNATIQEAITLGRKAEVDQNKFYTMIDVKGVQTYWGAVNISGSKYFMFIVDNEDSYSSGDMTKLAEIIELAMGMWRYTPQRDLKVEFLKALRRGNKSLAYKLKDEAKIQGSSILTVFYGRGIFKEPCSTVLSSIEDDEQLELIKIREKDELYGLVLFMGEHDEDIIMEKRNIIMKWYNDLKEDKDVRIFHVTGVNGVEGAADGYKLISETWGYVGSVFPYKRAFTKYDLTLVSNCIHIEKQGGVVKKNFLELLSYFKNANDSWEVRGNKEKQLLDTLETFVLDAGMNSAKTSEFMGIHTNTVQYRLKKINEILDVEITGNRVIPGLTIALALIRLERVSII